MSMASTSSITFDASAESTTVATACNSQITDYTVPPNSFKVHSIWSTNQTVVNTFYGVVDVPILHIFTGELLLWDTEKYSGSKTIQKYNNLKGVIFVPLQ